MNPLDIIRKYYAPESEAYQILVDHSRAVADKAVAVAAHLDHLSPNIQFVYEAAMLHDIGIVMTATPELGCGGRDPYVRHGYLGRKMLGQENLWRHGLVCERHVGVGLTRHEIVARKLPLPEREMVPVSIEEQIVCYADKFFSKNENGSAKQRSIDAVVHQLSRYGEGNAERFLKWVKMFETA